MDRAEYAPKLQPITRNPFSHLHKGEKMGIVSEERETILILWKVDYVPKQTATLEEVSKYDILRLDDLQEAHNHLFGDNFTIFSR